jgi:hypothetical protein
MRDRKPRRALLISTIHEPIAFVSYRRMYSLLRREVVDVITEWPDDRIVRDLKTPAILRLKDFILARTAHKMCGYNRGVVFARDDYRCQYCSRFITFREATIDHVVPRSRGGKNHWTNCVTACKNCNRRKDNKTPEEAGMKLLRKPGLPSVAHFWLSDTRKEPSREDWHPSWDEFIAT